MHNCDFQLARELQQDCIQVIDLPLSKILLMNDSQFPWFIQVPRINNVKEVIELNDSQYSQLWYESKMLSQGIMQLYSPDKLNIGALGNMVPQLHIHHIARFKNDIAWPKPVWGSVVAKPYQSSQLGTIIENMQTLLKEKLC